MINRLKKLPKFYGPVLKTASSIAAGQGSSIYLVGGVVRDLFLNRDIFDLDIVVEGDAIALAEELASRLKAEFKKHHCFGTATVELKGYKLDFATSRKEYYSFPGALPKVSPASLGEDLFRRDFTINAMAISLNKKDYGRLIDIYNGVNDLKSGKIRVLHENSFMDDPTRILRAIRFEQRFSFMMDLKTSHLLREAINAKALTLVSPHRLRDEIILILKEAQPLKHIKRIDKLIGINFIHKDLKLKNDDYVFFKRAQGISSGYLKSFKTLRKQQYWIIYLSKILIRLSAKSLENLLHDYAFRKGERIIILSIKASLFKARKLKKPLKKSLIYRFLNPLSFEAILFFYVYYPDKIARENIDCFLKELVKTNLRIRGRDLTRLGLVPNILFGKVFEKLMHVKIDKGISTKKGEMIEALEIFRSLSRPKPD
ncbi:MAG: CCA tRNA nucleotidyltransferase [Candidatus Omnitrophica bacterium]|nr:CCA tRNA nucleotidyltransferase [Candidatus Omnitrophota bacterium]